uniref:Nuclear transport factor 2 n=1 Tax=Grammatophora oceanica TaxID=210454 RepID=A0A7S1UZF9_9STRA|mmetsp:Transcript_30942/g.45876  ORF Transcript_30942/g.45876 Transcript_30942/m.45876 type:complete len:122 (+) Transcript_30942:98-463(+)
MSADEIAKAFVNHYYQTFSSNVGALSSLFTPQSMMTFEGAQLQGADNIVAKLQSIGQVQHDIKSTDVQPSNDPNAILIFVTGAVKIGGDNPLHYCEMFQLIATAPGQYVIHNNVFRLNYGL